MKSKIDTMVKKSMTEEKQVSNEVQDQNVLKPEEDDRIVASRPDGEVEA